MKKLYLLILFIQISYTFSRENAKITFQFEKNTFQNDTKVFVKIQNYLLNKFEDIDTLNLIFNNFEQTFTIKRSDSLRYYFFFTENNEWITSVLLNNKDSVVVNLFKDTTDNIDYKILFQRNPYQSYFDKKINWFNDKKYYENFSSYNISGMFEYADNIFKFNLMNFKNEFGFDKIDKQIYNYIFGNIKYVYYHKLIRYLVERYYFKNKTDSLLEYYTHFLYNNDTVNVVNEYSQNSNCSSYYDYIRMSIDQKYKTEWKTDNFKGNLIAHIKKIKILFKGLMRDKLIYDYLKNLISNSNNIKQLEEILNIITDLEKNKFGINFINELKYQISDIEAIMPGTKVKDYEFTDIKGNQVKLSDFNGKFVYLNLWALWCGACQLYFEDEKELYSKYKDKDIYFLNIAIETVGYKKWSDFVKRKELSGIQLLYKGTLQNQLGKDFRLEGIPHFIILDKEGNIINPSAPYPNDEKLLLEFKKIGIE